MADIGARRGLTTFEGANGQFWQDRTFMPTARTDELWVDSCRQTAGAATTHNATSKVDWSLPGSGRLLILIARPART